MASNPQQGEFNAKIKQQKQKPKNDNQKHHSKQRVNHSNHVQPVAGPSKAFNDVLSTLECPVCMEFFQPPIFLCETGHNICGTCRHNLCLPICPICKGGVTGQRNFALEDICLKMGTICPNASHGCKFTTTPEKVKNHFEDCPFRQCFCPIGKAFQTCGWTGSHNQLVSHFSQNHKQNMSLKAGCQIMFPEFDINKNDQDLQLVCVGKKLFVYHVKIDVKKNIAFWAIQYVGSAEAAKEWRYEINIYNNKKTQKVITFLEGCFSDTCPIETVFDSGECVGIPLLILKHYVHDNKKFTFKFFVRSSGKNAAKIPDIQKPLAAMKLE